MYTEHSTSEINESFISSYSDLCVHRNYLTVSVMSQLMSIHILVQTWVSRVLLKQSSCPQDFTDIIAHNIEMENIPEVRPWWKNREWHRREKTMSTVMMVMTKDISHKGLLPTAHQCTLDLVFPLVWLSTETVIRETSKQVHGQYVPYVYQVFMTFIMKQWM